MRAKPQRRIVLERWHTSEREGVTVISASSPRQQWTHWEERSDERNGVYFRMAAVPTKHGFVRVWSWPDAAEYELIYRGELFNRRDEFGAPSKRALCIRASLFAKKVVNELAAKVKR